MLAWRQGLRGMPEGVVDPGGCEFVEPEFLSIATRGGIAIAESVGRCAACGQGLPWFGVAPCHLPGGPDGLLRYPDH